MGYLYAVEAATISSSNPRWWVGGKMRVDLAGTHLRCHDVGANASHYWMGLVLGRTSFLVLSGKCLEQQLWKSSSDSLKLQSGSLIAQNANEPFCVQKESVVGQPATAYCLQGKAQFERHHERYIDFPKQREKALFDFAKCIVTSWRLSPWLICVLGHCKVMMGGIDFPKQRKKSIVRLR